MKELKIKFNFNGQKYEKVERVPEDRYLEIANAYEKDSKVESILIRG
jgi:hypothetical protein